MTYEYNKYPDLYMDYVNNILTIERFADYYGMSTEYAKHVIKIGRILTEGNHEKSLQATE